MSHLPEPGTRHRPLPPAPAWSCSVGPGRLRPGRGALKPARSRSAPPTVSGHAPTPRKPRVGPLRACVQGRRGAEGAIRMVGDPPGWGCARAATLPRPACACAAEARRGAVRFRRRGPAWRGSGPGRAGPGPKCLYFSPRCWSCCWLRLAHSS